METRSPSNNVCFIPSDVSTVRIAGFGACMISGYPHEGGGLLEVACSLVEKELSRPIEINVLTLPGFPAPRAVKYLNSKIVPFDPDYVVFQFGSTDAARPIRNRHSPTVSTSDGRAFARPTSLALAPAFRAPTLLSTVRWHTQSLGGFFWKTAPVTSLSSYVNAIEHMVSDCISAEITPVVLSPFIFGSFHSRRSAATYTTPCESYVGGSIA